MADKKTEQDRNQQALSQLKPFALIGDERGEGLLSSEGAPKDMKFLSASEVVAAIRGETAAASTDAGAAAGRRSPVSPESVLVYVYTGGTTKASKCVTVTHAMAMWEADNYSIALRGRAGAGDKMLQASTLYWGAAVFGQMSIGFAVGACVCIGGRPTGCGGAGDALRQLVDDVNSFGISVLGVVPSQLRGAWPDGPSSMSSSVHTLVAWADKCPPELSRRWQTSRIQVIDLLIASEYWLALHSDCSVYKDGTVEKHIYRRLPTLEARFLVETNGATPSLRDAVSGEVGEMYLAGPTTSPGYVCPDGHVGLDFHDAERVVDGKKYLRTRDQLLLLKDGGLVYSGRADSMMKHGGQWVDADALQDAVTAIPGVTQAAVIPGALGIDAFVVMHSSVLDGGAGEEVEAAGGSPSKRPCLRGPSSSSSAPFRLLSAVRKALPSSTPGGCRIHLRSDMPLNPATAKIDRKALAAELDALRDSSKTHHEVHEALERRMVGFYGAWGSLAVGVVCAPQLIATAAAGLRDVARVAGVFAAVSSPAHALMSSTVAAASEAALRLGASCAGRLLALPELWLAATFLEERLKDDPRARSFAEALKRRGLPSSWSRWLPLPLAALLPSSWLGLLVAVSCTYVAWGRERDPLLALGVGSATAALALPPGVLPTAHWPRVVTSAALGLATALLRPSSLRELAIGCASAPGIFWQVLPKYLSDDFGYALERRLIPRPERQGWRKPVAEEAESEGAESSQCGPLLKRLASSFRQPSWKQRLVFDDAAAVVDRGNKWDQVELTSCDGSSPWNSIGVRVRLSEALKAEDSPLSHFLNDGRGARSEAAASGVNGDAHSSSGNIGMAKGVTGSNGSDKGPVAGLTALVERICGGQGADALHGLDSMQAIQLTEAIRREFQRPLGVVDVLKCSDVEQLAAALDNAIDDASLEEQPKKKARLADEAQPWRLWLCGMGPQMCTVDWMVSRKDSTKHLDLEALQRALDRLIERHAALRTRNDSEVAAFDSTYNASAMWQLFCAANCRWTNTGIGRWASNSIFSTWPRTMVLKMSHPDAKTKLLLPTMGEVLSEGYDGTEDQRAFWAGGALYNRGKPGELFRVCALPIFKNAPSGLSPDSDAVSTALALPPDEVRWYIYAVLDHGYCDGPAGTPLFADFLRLYAEESGEAASDSSPALKEHHRPTDALATLQHRLRQSLKPLPEAHHPNDDIFHDGLVGFGWRRGFQRHIRMEESLLRVLRLAARDALGCSVDVAWLTVISAAFLRLFPHLRRLDLYLIVTCRDGPGQAEMVGYFSSRKLIPMEIGDPSRATILGLADLIGTTRRQRTWRRPRPFEKADAIEVNLVSQAADGLPIGFQEVRCSRSAPRDWDRGATSNMNLRLDQTSRDGWDFRLQSHDSSWGEHWSSYFAQAMGSVIVDLALRPLDPIVPGAL